MEYITVIYKGIYWIVAIFCTYSTCKFAYDGWHIYEIDDDLSKVRFRKYNEEPNTIYPTITLCFSREMVYTTGDYDNFKYGTNVEFDPKTINTEDFLFSLAIVTSNGQRIWLIDSMRNNGFADPHFKILPLEELSYFNVGYQDFRTKCFSLDLKMEKGSTLDYVGVFINNSIFRPTQ